MSEIRTRVGWARLRWGACAASTLLAACSSHAPSHPAELGDCPTPDAGGCIDPIANGGVPWSSDASPATADAADAVAPATGSLGIVDETLSATAGAACGACVVEACATVDLACSADVQCVGLVQCGILGGATTCALQFPDGVAEFNLLATCLQNACTPPTCPSLGRIVDP